MLSIEPLTALALSVHANPGVYALLVASGISKAADIPTGWGVTLDLIERLAVAEGEKTDNDPSAWFHQKYKADADYSDLLDQLYDQGSRQAKLRAYFEPTEEEREAGKKLPTKAHKAIARLVRDRYVRVIVTPNFDHLLEEAIRAEGVEPVVISTADAADGAPPLVHTTCTIIKVHGDYLDARIKNTKQELDSYDPRMDRLLDSVFDDFGLVVCGWSATWDIALRTAVARTPNRRYRTFWSVQSEPTGEAANLITLRFAKVFKISSADDFFDSLAEKVLAIADMTEPDPADIHTAVAMVKRFVPEDRYRVRLYDLLTSEAKAAKGRLGEVEGKSKQLQLENLLSEFNLRQAAVEKMLHMLAAGGFHSRGPEQSMNLRKCVEMLGSDRMPESLVKTANYLTLYAATLAIYVSSISAFAADNDYVAAEMLNARGVLGPFSGRILPLAASSDLDEGVKVHPGFERAHTPMSDWLHQRCHTLVSNYFVDQATFDLAFDRFEYMVALVAQSGEDSGDVFNYGRWMWKAANSSRKGLPDMRLLVGKEINRDGHAWPFLKIGLFGGSLQKLLEHKKRLDERLDIPIRRFGGGL